MRGWRLWAGQRGPPPLNLQPLERAPSLLLTRLVQDLLVLDTYSHVIPVLEEDAAERLAARLD